MTGSAKSRATPFRCTPFPAILTLFALAAAFAAPAAAPAGAQDVLDRSPNVSGAWVGLPWTLHLDVPHRFGDGAHTSTFTGVLGLPHGSAAGVAWASGSRTVAGETHEVELFVRRAFIAPAGLGVTVAWNQAAESLDAEASLARWIGPLRLLGAARWFADPRAVDAVDAVDAGGTGDDRFALAGGVVWQPLAGRAPVALVADVAAPLDLADGEELAWSAGVQAGIPHTALTMSLQATNTAATTLQGATLATVGTRFGFALTAPIPAGFFLGRYPPRESAMESVVEEPEEPAGAVVEIRRYAYAPARVVIEAGSVVEWVNRDVVVHTATAEDGAWDSGAIRQGGSWRARFDRPGTYPYYCGPHPFMKGVVIVR